MNNKNIELIKPAAKPGLHSSSENIAKEYLKETVKKRLKFLISSQNWSNKKIREYQFLELKKLLINSFKNVPFYRREFEKIKFNPFKFSKLEEIKQLPVIDKKIVIQNHKEFIAENIDFKNLNYMTTGGSTGNPLKIIMNSEIRSLAHANTQFYMQIAGFKLNNEKSIRLHGNQISDELIKKKQYWYFENNRLIMSVYHISEITCSAYLNVINKFNPRYIHSYPSAIYLLTRLAKRNNYKFPKSVKAIFCDSETLYPEQKTAIETYFKIKVFNTYGHTEGAVLGITYPNSNDIELVPQIGLTEILNRSGHIADKKDTQGNIVVTGFNNHIFPLIRYDTKDIGIIKNKDKGNIKYLSLKCILGRTQDYLISNVKEIVPAAPFLFDYNFDWSGIQQFQLYQDTPGLIIVRIVKDNNSLNLEKKIMARFSEVLKEGFVIKVMIVKEINKTPIGKFRYVDQRLNVEDYI